MTGDGRVTLNEAYQFAFHETLARTSAPRAARSTRLTTSRCPGSGDVVMTDLRETTSTLVLGEGQYGRFYVLDSDRQLVAELHKALGRRVELGVEPGTYDVFVEQDATRRTASVTLADGERRELTAAELRATKLLPSRRRGPEDRDDLLDGRLRAQLGATVWNDRSGSGGRYSVVHWNKPWLAYEFSFGTGQLPAAAPTSCWERATTLPSGVASDRTGACCSAAPKWPTGSGLRRSATRAGSSRPPSRSAWTSSSAATSRSTWGRAPPRRRRATRHRDVRRRGLRVRGPRQEIARPNP